MKGNTASMIALIVATLVLLVVGGNSYRNYLRAQYEREYGVLEKHREVASADSTLGSGAPAGTNVVPSASTLDPGPSTLSQSSNPSTASLNSPNAPALSATTQRAPGASPGKAPGTGAVDYQVGTPPPTLRSSSPTPQAGAGSAASSDPSVDPEIARLQARLKALEQESSLYQNKLNQTRGGDTPSSSAPVAKPIDSGSLREVMANGNKGASPSLFPETEGGAVEQNTANAEFEKQIREAPAAGKVLAFNADWGFVQIDAGKNRNITPGARFAVRRGVSIVGYVKVKEVSDKMSIAELTSRNKFSETARKPKPGDEVISWPLF